MLCVVRPQDFSEGSDIDVAAVLEKVSGVQLSLPGHKERVQSDTVEFFSFFIFEECFKLSINETLR